MEEQRMGKKGDCLARVNSTGEKMSKCGNLSLLPESLGISGGGLFSLLLV